MIIPTVLEKSAPGERAYDIWSRLLKDRIIFLGQEVDDYITNLIIAQMLFLDKEDAHLPIELPSRDIVLYNDQLDYQSSIQKLDEFGFELVYKHDFEIFGYDGKPCSPESNVIMKNKLL
jgi:hypothetical protein